MRCRENKERGTHVCVRLRGCGCGCVSVHAHTRVHAHTVTKKETVISYHISENQRTGRPQGLGRVREETVQALPGADKFTWPGEPNPAREIRVIKVPSPSGLCQRAPSSPSLFISEEKTKSQCSPPRNGTVTRLSQFT